MILLYCDKPKGREYKISLTLINYLKRKSNHPDSFRAKNNFFFRGRPLVLGYRRLQNEISIKGGVLWTIR